MQGGQVVRRRAPAMLLAMVTVLGAVAIPTGTAQAAATASPPATTAPPSLPAQPPVIVAPLDGAASATEPVLAWTPVPGAGHYAVQIASDPGFADPAYDIVTAATSATPEVDLAPGTWYWRVAVDEGGERGPWAGATFEKTASLGVPVQTAPADGTLVAHPAAPTIAWTGVDGASSYEIELSRFEDHSAPFLAATRATSWTIEPLEIGETFHWRVRAVARDGVTAGSWSAWRSVGATWANDVTGLAPADGAAVRDLVLSWNPVAGAATYHVELTPVSGPYWGEPVVRSFSTAGTRLEAEGFDPFPEGSTWSWRVRSMTGNPDDPLGPWSSPRLVTRSLSAAPGLLAPADGATTGQVLTLAWTAASRASMYEIQVSADAGFASGVATYETTETAFDLTTSEDIDPHVLVKGETYHWRVRGRNHFRFPVVTTDASAWSAVRTFTWDPPVATLTAPADGAEVVVPTLSWDLGGTARFVRVTVEDDDGTIVERQVTYGTTWTPTAKLDAADGPFTWYVERVAIPGGDDATVAWRSAERTFDLAAAPAGGASPELVGVDGLHTIRTPLLTWSPVAGAASYRVYRWLDVDPLPDPLTESWSPDLAYPAWTPPDHGLDARPYDVRVLAFDAQDDILAIGGEATFTIDLLPAPSIVSPADCGDPGCPVYADAPRLAWTAVAGATAYGVSVRSTWLLSGAAYVPGTSWQPETDLAREHDGSGPVWSVRACIESRCGPAADAAVLVALPAPVQVTPADGATVAGPQVTVTWADLKDAPVPAGSTGPATSEAGTYRSVLQGILHPDTVGNDDVDGVASTYLLSPDTYTWDLWAYTGSGIPTRTATRTFTVTWAGPTATAPAAGAVVAHVPTLAWTPMSPAKTYEVEVFRGTSTQVSDRVLSITTPDAATTPFEELDAGTYTWRVRTRVDGAASSWGTSRTFSIAGSDAPVLVEPADGDASADGLVEFAWQPVDGATAYRFESDDDPAFGSPRESVVTGQPNWVPLDAYPSATWSWRVRALGPSNAVLATSAVRTLDVDLVEPVVSEPWEALARARASAAGAAPVDVAWDGSDTQAGDVRYDVRRSVDGGPFQPFATGIQFTGIRPLLTSGHTYRYAVQAVDAAGHRSAWEYGRTFRVRAFGDGPANVTYRGAWSVSQGDGYLGGSVHRSTSPTAKASFGFSGRQVAWVAAVGPTRGRARVYVDGRYVTTVNLHASDAATRRVVFTKTWAKSGTHTVRVEVMGTRGHARVDVDGFVTLR